MKRRTIGSVVAAATLAGAGFAATAPAAEATSRFGCSWPNVCFYKTNTQWVNRTPSAAFQQVTSYWQGLGTRSYGSAWVYNSRNDDRALIHFTNGFVMCLPPNSWSDLRGYYPADKVMIQDRATC